MYSAPRSVLEIVDGAIQTSRRAPLAAAFAVGGSVPAALLLLGGAMETARAGAELPGALVLGPLVAGALILRAAGWSASLLMVREAAAADPVRESLFRRALARTGPVFVAMAWKTGAPLAGLALFLLPILASGLASNLRERFWTSVLLILGGVGLGLPVLLAALIYSARRVAAIPMAAEGADAVTALRRSVAMTLGHTIRGLLLEALVALLFVLAWVGLAGFFPALLEILTRLTGRPLLEARALFDPGRPDYLAFQGMLAWLLLEPVRCHAAALFRRDAATRREGDDLRRRLEQWAPSRSPVPEPAAGEKP